MDALPEGWTRATIEALAGPDGLMTDGDWIESKDQDPEGSVRLIQLADVGDGVFLDKSRRFVTSETAERLRCTYLKPGDVLIARMPDPLGRACVFPGVGQPAITAVDVCVWRGGLNSADPHWLMHAINSPDVRGALAMLASGTTRQRVSGGNLKRFELPVPPLAEQRRIVARIQALFGRTRRARAELRRVASLKHRYRRHLLRQSFDDVAGSSVPPLGALLLTIDAGKNIRCEERVPGPGERGIVKISAVTWGRFDAEEIKTAPPNAELDSRSRIDEGDFLLSRANTLELVGAPVIAEGVPPETYLSDKVLRLRFREPIERWVMWYLRSPVGRAEIEGRSSGNQLSMRNIGQGALREIPIPLPPADMRDTVLSKIENGHRVTQTAEREVERALSLLSRLESAILGKALKGELPQGASEEPASAVLSCSEVLAAAPARARRRRAA